MMARKIPGRAHAKRRPDQELRRASHWVSHAVTITAITHLSIDTPSPQPSSASLCASAQDISSSLWLRSSCTPKHHPHILGADRNHVLPPFLIVSCYFHLPGFKSAATTLWTSKHCFSGSSRRSAATLKYMPVPRPLGPRPPVPDLTSMLLV